MSDVICHNRTYRLRITENGERRTDTFSFRWYLGKSDIQIWQDHLCSLIVADSHVPAILITSRTPHDA